MDIITSKDNKHIKEYAKLCQSKAFRDQTGLFAIESVKLVKEAQANHIQVETVFVTEACLEKWTEPLEKFFQSSKCYLISDDLENKLSVAKTPQGIYAICKKLDKSLSMSTIYTNGKYLLLCDLQDAGNVGTIIRTAESVGIDGILVSTNNCDLYNPKTLRASMGSIFRMNSLLCENIEQTLQDCNANNCLTIAAVVGGSQTKDAATYPFANPCVLCIGNEGNGLSTAIVNQCKEQVTIKMKGNAESLNAAMAAGILMWEMCKSK